MSIVKIYAGEIELEFKKETLTLKKENNSLSTDLKVTHSSFPFLIIENENTKKALGSADITSISKKKIIPVTVLELGVKYSGELQQLSIVRGFRKCNLKYSSDILSIINDNISDFMPIVSVIPGETDPIPYTEESDVIVAGSANWKTYPVPFLNKVYPEVKWQFPTMYWKNKFGIDLELGDEWFSYRNHINLFNEEQTEFLLNSYTLIGSTILNINQNVPSPQIFLLSPLYYICEYIGFKPKGEFVNDEFIKRILFLSTKDNFTTNYVLLQAEQSFYLPDIEGPYGVGFYQSSFFITSVIPTRHYFTIHFEEPFFTNPNASILHRVFQINFNNINVYKYEHLKNTPAKIYEASFYIDVDSPYLDQSIVVSYTTDQNSFPIYTLKYSKKALDNTYQQMHPTIETGRYVPEWTVGSYLNYLKNQFNLDITLDDFKREIQLNFNENIENDETPVIIEKSLVLSSYDLAANSSFVLKYENDEDIALYISKEEVSIYTNQEDDYTKFLDSKFKFVPRNAYTSTLSEEIEDKEGVGLMIYDEVNAPYTSQYYFSKHLNINEPGGIYDTFWKRWLKFRLNASACEIAGFFTEIEIAKIYQAKSIYIDNQRYRISSIEYSESTNNLHELKMSLESVNY